jgi:hypothetical protein
MTGGLQAVTALAIVADALKAREPGAVTQPERLVAPHLLARC